MDVLPSELKTPPLGAVALVGLPSVHASISAHLRSELRPPLHSISVASVDAAAQLFPARKPKPAGESAPQVLPLSGVLRADWLTKHRQHRPALAVVFFQRDAVVSGATHAALCAQLEAVRAAVRRRGALLLVVLVGDAPGAPLPEEKLASVLRHGALDARFVVQLVAVDGVVQAAGLRRLALMLQETAVGFYRVEGARAAAKLGPRLVHSEASARAAFKAAVFAEFRQDWASALQFYRAAYTAVTELAAPSAADPRRWQRWYERAAVSEWCHFKLVTLLLHTGIPADAVAQLQRHVAKYRRPPAGLPSVLLPAHWGYLLRQFSIFGELLQARLPAGQQAAALPHAEQPGTYFAAAANAGIHRRKAWEVLLEMHDALPTPPQAVAGVYVGQFRREPGGPSLSDAEFGAFLGAAETPDEYSKTNLELLSRAHTLLKHANPDAVGCRRALSAILSQMANEYLCAGDSASALRLLRSVATVHRQEGWDALLAGTLASLRECAGRLSLHDEHAEWSLELGSLHADAGTSASERAAVLSAALAALCVRDDGSALTIPAETCLTCVCGFSSAPIAAGDSQRFYVALQCRTADPLHVRSAALGLQSDSGAESTVELLRSDGESLDTLQPGAWTVLCAAVATPAAGTLQATAVLLHVSAFSTLRSPLTEAGPLADASPLACADPLAVGAARISRLGAVVGQLTVAGSVGVPSGTLSAQAPARALAGELVRVDVTLAALEDAFQESECTFVFAADGSSTEEVAPELFIQDGAALQAVQGTLRFPALMPHTQATRTLWARWTQACAPHDAAVSLMCSTAKGQALLETRALMPLVQAALELQPTFTSCWQQHCLLPGAAPHAVLALGERAVLNASLRATGDLIICAVDLETDACWASRAQANGALPHDVAANDCFLQSFELTPSAAGLQPSPGVVIVRWRTPPSAALGLPDVISRLPLPSVVVEEAPLTVCTVLPDTFVLGQPSSVCTRIHNRTALVQELAITVSDAAGFVFAGERSSDIEVLPHSATELRHTVVAHATGWQPLPEVAITATRYVSRLAALSVREAVCVRPLARGVGA